jgi:hypothetical protein
MRQFLESILDQVKLTTLVDIGITALLIYWLFSLIRGTRAVRLAVRWSGSVALARSPGSCRPRSAGPASASPTRLPAPQRCCRVTATAR